jgi:hypothetical protein
MVLALLDEDHHHYPLNASLYAMANQSRNIKQTSEVLVGGTMTRKRGLKMLPWTRHGHHE